MSLLRPPLRTGELKQAEGESEKTLAEAKAKNRPPSAAA
jgi:hypothetical protein